MNHNLSMRNRRLLVFLLIGAGILVLAVAGHSLPTDSRAFLWGLVIGLSAAVAVVGVKMWRQKAFMRRLRVSADRNNKRDAD